MSGCMICSDGCLCVAGAKLRRRLERARAVYASTPTDLERANVCRAEAAWASHCHGDWSDFPDYPWDSPVQFTTEEEHNLAQVRARHAALIDERRKGMRQR